MIRVLHVVTIMNRNGLENRIMDIYRNIDRNKVQFDFLVQRKEKGMFDDEIKRLGGKIFYFQKPSPVKFISYINGLNKFFKKNNDYKIVHSHINTFSTWILMVAKRNDIPIRIAHSRTWGMEKSWKSLFKIVSKLFINIPTTHKFACSKQAGEWLFGKKGIEKPNYFRVIPNSIIIEKFSYKPEIRKQIRNKLGLKETTKAYVHVGRFVPQKNHEFLLKVFKQLTLLDNDSVLYLFGEGELESMIILWAKQLNIFDKIKLMGNVSNVGDYLNAMDSFIFPSIFEGFGTVVIEAQCSGLPVLASDSIPYETKVSNLQEFMSLNDSELLWANKLYDMTVNNNRRDHSLEIKQAGYDIKDTYKSLEKFYLEVMGLKYES